ncbi:MAG: hypothetical protein V1885_03480 [Candidatus Brennerbacteria bacterium]
MHITARRIVFYSLVAIFIVGGLYAVLSALGLTVATGGTIMRTGSLFVAPIPRDADLFLGGALVEESPRFLSGGTLIKTLTPKTYEVRAEHEGRVTWRAELPVSAGLVTRATDVFLWPKQATSTLVASNTNSFSLSVGIPAIRTESGTLFIDGVRIPGEEIMYASDDSATLITRTGNTIYLVGNGPSDSTINLTSLFHSLKERELGLPGIVPLVEVRPHPFSAGKFIIVTETSLYSLDTRRISLERLVTLPDIAATAFNDSEVLLLGSDGNLTAVDLIFKTADTAPFTSSTVSRLTTTADGGILTALTEDHALFAYYRASGEHVKVAENVSEFALSQSGNRLSYVSDNTVSVYFLDRYEGDALALKGATLHIWEGSAVPRGVQWNSSLSRYLFFVSGGKLVAAEVGLYGERNHTVLAENVRSFALTGFTAYLVREDGTLVALSFEE